MATLKHEQKTKLGGTSKGTKVDAKPLKGKGISAANKPGVEAFTKALKTAPLSKTLVSKITAKKSPTTPRRTSYAAKARGGLGVTRAIFARMTGVSERTLASWEAGKAPTEAGVRRLKEMARLGEALAEVMKPAYIPTWLNTPCEALGGLKPVEVLERGEADRLWRVVLRLGSGMPV